MVAPNCCEICVRLKQLNIHFISSASDHSFYSSWEEENLISVIPSKQRNHITKARHFAHFSFFFSGVLQNNLSIGVMSYMMR